MPRIKKNDFTREELLVICAIIGMFGGCPHSSYRKYVDSAWNKLWRSLSSTEKQIIRFVEDKINTSMEPDNFGYRYLKLEDGFFEEEKC